MSVSLGQRIWIQSVKESCIDTLDFVKQVSEKLNVHASVKRGSALLIKSLKSMSQLEQITAVTLEKGSLFGQEAG